jgi:hypothetical protein
MTITEGEWNPRYLEYCRVTGGLSPEATLARDRERWPGGAMTGFVVWMPAQWATWRRLNGYKADAILDDEAVAAFDAWLRTVPEEVPQ